MKAGICITVCKQSVHLISIHQIFLSILCYMERFIRFANRILILKILIVRIFIEAVGVTWINCFGTASLFKLLNIFTYENDV